MLPNLNGKQFSNFCMFFRMCVIEMSVFSIRLLVVQLPMRILWLISPPQPFTVPKRQSNFAFKRLAATKASKVCLFGFYAHNCTFSNAAQSSILTVKFSYFILINRMLLTVWVRVRVSSNIKPA